MHLADAKAEVLFGASVYDLAPSSGKYGLAVLKCVVKGWLCQIYVHKFFHSSGPFSYIYQMSVDLLR